MHTSLLNGIGGTVGSNSNISGTNKHFIHATQPSTSADIGPGVPLTKIKKVRNLKSFLES